MTKKYLKLVGSTFVVSAFLLLAFGSEDSKSKSGESNDSNKNSVESNESNGSSGETDNSNSNSSSEESSSEETSKEVYRQGYADGQMGYGLPASETATAMESYMAHSYNFSSADIPVYVMGYNDAITGKSAEY